MIILPRVYVSVHDDDGRYYHVPPHEWRVHHYDGKYDENRELGDEAVFVDKSRVIIAYTFGEFGQYTFGMSLPTTTLPLMLL